MTCSSTLLAQVLVAYHPEEVDTFIEFADAVEEEFGLDVVVEGQEVRVWWHAHAAPATRAAGGAAGAAAARHRGTSFEHTPPSSSYCIRPTLGCRWMPLVLLPSMWRSRMGPLYSAVLAPVGYRHTRTCLPGCAGRGWRCRRQRALPRALEGQRVRARRQRLPPVHCGTSQCMIVPPLFSFRHF